MPIFETSVVVLLGIAVGSYLLGSVPFGIVVSKLFGLPDPRTVGSKNIGATNVLRSGSKAAALATVLLDAGKGGIAVLIARSLSGDDASQVAALFSFLGHLYPVWLGFKGGKGVATFLGTLLALTPMVGLIALASWLFTYFVFRYSSLSALMASILTPLVAILLGYGNLAALLLAMSGLLIWKHRANIERLRDGTEPMVSWGKKE